MLRILVIDDDDQIRKMLCLVLKRKGYDVVSAPNGKIGVTLYHEEPADLVITDISMPEKDGIEVITDLRRDFPKVKIVAISGGSKTHSSVSLQTARVTGAHHALTKPFSIKELVTSIQDLVGVGENQGQKAIPSNP